MKVLRLLGFRDFCVIHFFLLKFLLLIRKFILFKDKSGKKILYLKTDKREITSSDICVTLHLVRVSRPGPFTRVTLLWWNLNISNAIY